MIVIDRNAIWIDELAWLVAILAELGHERAAVIAREYLHSMIVALNDEQEASIVVECQASREVEQAISIASFLGADRELDSSITIKSIVFHLSSNPIQSLSLSQNDKEMISNSNLQQQQQQGQESGCARGEGNKRMRRARAPCCSCAPRPPYHSFIEAYDLTLGRLLQHRRQRTRPSSWRGR